MNQYIVTQLNALKLLQDRPRMQLLHLLIHTQVHSYQKTLEGYYENESYKQRERKKKKGKNLAPECISAFKHSLVDRKPVQESESPQTFLDILDKVLCRRLGHIHTLAG